MSNFGLSPNSFLICSLFSSHFPLCSFYPGRHVPVPYYGAGRLTWPTGTHHFRRGRYLGSHGRSGPKAGAIDASTKPAKVPIAPGPTTRSLGFIEGPEGGPAAAAYLDGQPAISGRMGEADSTQPTRNGPCHRRLGFGLDPGLISLADGPFYTKSVSVSLSILRTGSSSVRMGSLP